MAGPVSFGYQNLGFGAGVEEAGLEVTYLVLAGGGGGDTHHNRGAGGGGAGGYRTSFGSGNISGAQSAVETPLTLDLSTNYAVSIGGGGAGGNKDNGPEAANGTNTVFSTIEHLSVVVEETTVRRSRWWFWWWWRLCWR